MTTKIGFHELANIFPLLEGFPFQELVHDIKENGLREPIALLDGLILDGRNRYLACQKAGVVPETIDFKKGDALAFVVSKNLRRRHLKDNQRAMIAARLVTMKRGRPSQNTVAVTQSQAAQLLNVSAATVVRAASVIAHASPVIRSMVEEGKISVVSAQKISGLSVERQNAVAKKGASAVVAESRRVGHLPKKQGRSEFAQLWPFVDEIIAGLEQRRLDKADLAARALSREISKIAAERKAKL